MYLIFFVAVTNGLPLSEAWLKLSRKVATLLPHLQGITFSKMTVPLPGRQIASILTIPYWQTKMFIPKRAIKNTLTHFKARVTVPHRLRQTIGQNTMTSAGCFKLCAPDIPIRATYPAQVQKTGEFLCIKSSFSRASMKLIVRPYFNLPKIQTCRKMKTIALNKRLKRFSIFSVSLFHRASHHKYSHHQKLCDLTTNHQNWKHFSANHQLEIITP